MPKFKTQVLAVVSQIPNGQVLNYGTVAALAGSPRAARQVGQVLRGLGILENKVPWWRVVNKNMEISIKGSVIEAKQIQSELLQQEGWKVKDFKLVAKV